MFMFEIHWNQSLYINQLTSAIELDDETGYIVAGNLAEYHPERSWHVGLLAKISPEGELLMAAATISI
jgi:hypothetical protein